MKFVKIIKDCKVKDTAVGGIYQILEERRDEYRCIIPGTLTHDPRAFYIRKDYCEIVDEKLSAAPSWARVMGVEEEEAIRVEEEAYLASQRDKLVCEAAVNRHSPKQALRFNEGKIQWDLVDFKSLEPMVEVLAFGAAKYSANNWKKGLPISGIFSSLMRHMAAFMEGEDLDPESGKSHLGHAMCNLMFMSYHMKNNPEKLDDRYCG